MESNVTVVMSTYYNEDFTQASVWALRRFYPDIPIVLADGTNQPPNISNTRVVSCPGACTEDCRNAAAALVQTPYILFMDNDSKVIGPQALPLLMQALESDLVAAQSGAYAWVKIAGLSGQVGVEFDRHEYVDGFSCYFSLHNTERFQAVGGFPKRPPYDIPEHLWKDRGLPGHNGDFTIGLLYQEAGFENITPKAEVPVLHWSQANRWREDTQRDYEDWWYANTVHTRCNPMRGH